MVWRGLRILKVWKRIDHFPLGRHEWGKGFSLPLYEGGPKKQKQKMVPKRVKRLRKRF